MTKRSSLPPSLSRSPRLVNFGSCSPRPLGEIADLISRIALASVVCLKTGANAHRLILFAENGLNQQSLGEGAGGEGLEPNQP